MKIQNSIINKTQNVQSSGTNQEGESKKNVSSSKEISDLGPYIPFAGLSKTINAKTLSEDLKMEPGCNYLIDKDSAFFLANNYINLQDKCFKKYVDELKPNESFVIGRSAVNPGNFATDVSRKHLKIQKDKWGRLIAQDLNSTFGTRIVKNVSQIDEKSLPFKLKPNQKYFVTDRAVIGLCDTSICLSDYKAQLDNLKEGDSVVVGRGEKADIKIQNKYISGSHFRIEKHKNGFVIEDLNSTNGTIVEDLGIKHYEDDYSNISTSSYLRNGVSTLIPKEAQINLGRNLTLDTRNKNILKMLDEKGSITVGRDDNCDIQINGVHDMVSRQHLKLSKTRDGIVATDLGSRNGTKIIPKNEIEPFYDSLKNMRIAQSNIGDCFLLSSVYALAQHPKGEEIIRNMVRVDENGNYIVTFHDTEPITVTPDELDGQTAKDGSKKLSVSGELGLKAIERAYGKKIKFEDLSRIPKDVFDNGMGKTLFMDIDQGGSCHSAMKALSGLETKSMYGRDDISGLLKKLDSEGGMNNYVLNCSTYKHGRFGKFMDKEQKFINNHLYAIKNYDAEKGTIDIVNPHDTRYLYTVDLNTFKDCFDYIYWTKVS